MSELPLGWSHARLGELGRWTGGGTPSKRIPAFWVGDIPWVSPKDMKVERIRDAEDHITGEAVEQSSTNLVPRDSVLVVTRSGILRHTLPVAVTDREVALNQDLKALIPTGGIVSAYIAWALRAFAQTILHTCSKAGTTVSNIETARMLDFAIPIAPTSEQWRIVGAIEEQFSRLDAADRSLRQAVARLDGLTVAIHRTAFQGDWPSEELARVADVRLGRQRSPKNHFGDNMRPYLRAANITWDGLDLSDVKQMNFTRAEVDVYRLEPGDLLVAEASGSPSEVGKTAIWNGELEDCCFQNTLLRVRTEEQLPEYLQIVLQHSALSGAFGRAAPGIGIHHLGAARLSAWPVPVPPRDEQRRIVAEVEQRLSVIKTVSEYYEQAQPALRDLFDTLDAHLTSLGDDVTRKTLKYYFAYRRIKNFACVEVHPQSGQLLIYLKVNPDDAALEEGFTRDVRKIVHFGTGDLELRISSKEDFDRAKQLIQRSYDES